MKAAFWHEKWANGQLGFHQEKINSRLKKYWSELDPDKGEAVFVPLCGKTLDMQWLTQQGHPVVGNEISDVACRDFFYTQRN